MITFEEVLIEDAQMEGYLKGEKEAKENVVRRLIIKHGFSNEQIADYADVSLSFVKKVRMSIKYGKAIN
ncbi:hypothetical protein [Pedobacter sp. L105]|uniref:hypothetical protein n=1 Tax=Pedobacter sp. L105 TaxID=1641871 RepID=UPI00131DF331|nr:hypothetical protein [Pedobacter sp. L105]